jgi:hypothetical protein
MPVSTRKSSTPVSKGGTMVDDHSDIKEMNTSLRVSFAAGNNATYEQRKKVHRLLT